MTDGRRAIQTPSPVERRRRGRWRWEFRRDRGRSVLPQVLSSSGNVEKPTEEEEGKQTRILLELISLLEPLLDGSFS